MSDNKENKEKDKTRTKEQGSGRLSLRNAGHTTVGKTVGAGSVRQSFSHGRSKLVQVEVRKKRSSTPSSSGAKTSGVKKSGGGLTTRAGGGRALTAAELTTRQRVLQEQKQEQKKEAERAAQRAAEQLEEEKLRILSKSEEERRQREAAETKVDVTPSRISEENISKSSEEDHKPVKQSKKTMKPLKTKETETSDSLESGKVTTASPACRQRQLAVRSVSPQPSSSSRPTRQVVPDEPLMPPHKPGERERGISAQTLRLRLSHNNDEADDEPRSKGASRKASSSKRKEASGRKDGGSRRSWRIDVQAAIEGDDDKIRSLASVRRQRERERRQSELERLRCDQVKVVRDIILPETITVQELANRMAARQGEVIKALMKMGVMATITQSIDADTAELIIEEFGHRVRRVSEADIELGIEGVEDAPEDLLPRAPVVTVMGHVDHGKTSLLDALRTTDVATGEAGGITQHIGAYQVKLASGAKITFLDTPGHEAFTAMRARGASMTDVVVLVVAADDGVMPQTIEAIKHAKAAQVPIVVAINKIDKPGVNPDRVRSELLQHDIVVESMGGDVQDVEVSALKRQGLDKLEEAILLQAEILELQANPKRPAEGVVIESRLDRGRGSVACVLVQKGTLRRGDIVVAGTEWGRVRVLMDDHGRQINTAEPSLPVEVLGLSGVPEVGASFVVLDNEARAREIAEFRQRRARQHQAASQLAARGTLDQMLARIQSGEKKEVSLLIKADVRGSAEAIQATVLRLANDEVRVRIINAAVGQIAESDVQLARASDAVIIAFNVRATVQARQLAQREGVDIRYYSIIYQVADDVEAMVRGKQAPKHREKFLGYAEIRKVFDISKIGKVAGCYVTEGVVKRGCGVRLLREGVVIHEGSLGQLKRFKDDVKEVARGYECGLSFVGYNDLHEGDVVECFESELITP